MRGEKRRTKKRENSDRDEKECRHIKQIHKEKVKNRTAEDQGNELNLKVSSETMTESVFLT